MNAPFRRGSCPGLSVPMRTGDGLLVRLRPVGTVALGTFCELCRAARAHGNDIVEITARGSVQVRGLTAASAPRFAAAIAALDIAVEEGIPVHADPLSSLDPQEILAAADLAAELRRAVADARFTARVSPKLAVAIDGGGALNLDRLSADIRLRAERIGGDSVFRASVGGNAASATQLGFIASAHGRVAAIRLLEVIAQRGRNARARDIVATEGIEPFRAAIADLLLNFDPPRSVEPVAAGRELIGAHRLRDGSFAFVLGLAFGHAEAASLENLAEAAATMEAAGIRLAPERGLIVVGLAENGLRAFTSEAERLGFIVRADDPRRNVIACAGAPVCGSAHLATRALAPRIATEHARRLRGSFTLHLSGCAKGCAHPAAAALTIVGTPDGCALVANGAARDGPFAIVPQDEVNAAIAAYTRRLAGEGRNV